MAFLTVIAPFGAYGRGQSITDAATIATILASPQKIFVVTVANPSPGTGVIVPTQPNAVTPVVGTPDPSLAASYGFALDLTSAPATLYRWSGTAFAVVLQAGSGPGAALPGAAVPSSAALSGAPSAVDALLGSVPSSASVTATPSTTPPISGLAGTVPASAGLSGAPAAVDSLSGAVPSSSNVVGFPGAVDSLTGTVPASASLSGTVSGTKTRSFARLVAFGLMGAAA